MSYTAFYDYIVGLRNWRRHTLSLSVSISLSAEQTKLQLIDLQELRKS